MSSTRACGPRAPQPRAGARGRKFPRAVASGSCSDCVNQLIAARCTIASARARREAARDARRVGDLHLAVDADHRVPGRREALRQPAPDEAGRAGDPDAHAASLPQGPRSRHAGVSGRRAPVTFSTAVALNESRRRGPSNALSASDTGDKMTTRIPLASLLRAPYRRPGEIDHIVRLPEVDATPPDDRASLHQTPSESAVKDTGIPATAAPTTPVATDESEVGSLRKLLLGALPDHYERQIERLEAKMAEGASELHAALSALEQRLEKRIAGADADSRASTGELRQLLLDEMRGANDAIRTYHADAMRRLEHGLQDVQDAKLDQATFSTFLGSLARYLSHQDAVPTNAEESR